MQIDGTILGITIKHTINVKYYLCMCDPGKRIVIV
jgi:hypothetical protein